jgi:hypothetical protein
MRAHPALLGSGRERVRRGVIEQQERAQFAPEPVVIEDGPDRESVADPVHARTLMNALQLFHGIISRRSGLPCSS